MCVQYEFYVGKDIFVHINFFKIIHKIIFN